MIKWTKPSGQVIETNDRPETIAKAEQLGWKRGNSGESKPTSRRKGIEKKV